jgi:hypothetical protein
MLASKYASRHGGVSFLAPLNLQKRSYAEVLHVLASKRASRHSRVHFFDI